jgi:hypothetical protein
MSGQWWSRAPDGRVELRLVADEAATLLGLVAELRQILEQPADDPVMERLFPRAYLDPTEDEAESVWRALAVPDLLRERLDRLQALVATLEPVARGARAPIVVDEDMETVWLGVLTDARLALGTALGVRDDEDPDAPDPPVDPDDPHSPAWHLYHVLTYFQGELIDVLLAALPEDGVGPAPGSD